MSIAHILQRRHFLFTFLGAAAATRMKRAACRCMQRAGNLTFQHHAVAALLAVIIRGRYGRKQCAGVRMQRVVEQLSGIHDLDQVAQVHNADAVRNMADNSQVMRHKNVGKAQFFLQVSK